MKIKNDYLNIFNIYIEISNRNIPEKKIFKFYFPLLNIFFF
jgi:hypothetical protein